MVGGSEPWYGDGSDVSSGGDVCQMNAYLGKGPWQEKGSKGKGGEREKKAGERKAVLRAMARITRGREMEREAASKAVVIGAASGVIPKVVVATRTST